MAPSDGEAKSTQTSLAEEPEQKRQWISRALRHNLRLPMRYRREGEGEEAWRQGETINISESGLLFCSDEMLEVDSRVEITFQTSGVPMLHSSTRQTVVVRRVLSTWPETTLLFGARFCL
jgi:PilZ domain